MFHFTDANPNATAADYMATITLGDGNVATLTSRLSGGGQIVVNPNGGFDVQLSYIYAAPLSGATFGVSVADVGGASTAQSVHNFSVATPYQATFSVGNVSGSPGGQITVPIQLSDGADNVPSADAVQAIQAVVTYDPNVLTINSVSAGSLLTSGGQSWLVQSNTNYNGSGNTLVLGAISTAGLSGNFSGEVFDLTFTVNAGATAPTKVYVAATTADAEKSTYVALADTTHMQLNPAPANGAGDPVFGTVAFGLSVTALTPTGAGFTATLSEPINPGVLHLYDTAAKGLRAPDVTLVGASVGAVGGSLIIAPGGESVTFIATDGVLPPDSYTATLRSAADGFETPSGVLLTGSDGTPGHNYTSTFTVAAPPAGTVTVRLPNFARGPAQNVNLPANATTGIPLTASNASGITSMTLDIDYNPALLDITGASTSIATATVRLDTSVRGVAHLTLSSSTPLAEAINADLIDLQANVPSAAASAYGSAQILSIANLSINNGALSSLPSAALQVVAYPGDTQATVLSSDGQGGFVVNSYSLQDALANLKNAVAVDTGFAAYPLDDPVIIGGVSGGSSIGLFDARDVLKAAVGLTTSDIPPLPVSLAAAPPAGAPLGPTILPNAPPFAPLSNTNVATFSVGNVSGAPGSQITVPITLNDGSDNLSSSNAVQAIQAVVTYDPSVLTIASISAGSLLTSGGQSWLVQSNTNYNGSGNTLVLGAISTAGLSGDFSGEAFDVAFTINAAATGSTKVYVAASTADSKKTTYVALADNSNLTLNPAPTNGAGDPVFGTVTVQGQTQAPAITSVNSTTFTAGIAGTFTVTTTGTPTATITESGALPQGVTLTDNQNGTATLASTAATPAGVYHFSIDASNGVTPDATQAFTLTVSSPSSNVATFSVGNVSGTPGSQITVPIELSDGADSLSAADAVQAIQAVVTYDPSALTIDSISAGALLTSGGQSWLVQSNTNYNGSGNTLVLGAISTSGLSGNFSAHAFEVTFTINAGATGSTKVYVAAATADGKKTTYVALADNSDLTLNPVPTNGASDPVFGTVTVQGQTQAPAITSVNSTTFTAGIAGTFTVTTTGTPTATITESGALPQGVTLTDNQNGTATLASTAATPAGVYHFSIDASNGVTPDATQAFTLTVSSPSSKVATFSVGNVSGTPGSQITVPIELSDGADNLSAADAVQAIQAVVTYDPSVLTIASISAGSLLTSGGQSWLVQSNTNYNGSGNTLVLAAISTSGLSGNFSGHAFEVTFTINAGATASTNVYVAAATADGKKTTYVGLADNSDLTLNPAPTNGAGDPVFGMVTVQGQQTQAPIITSVNGATFSAGTPGTFIINTTGLPTPTITENGGLPTGVTLTDNHNGTATLASTAATPAGVYHFTIDAGNGVTPDSLQNFMLTIDLVYVIGPGTVNIPAADGVLANVSGVSQLTVISGEVVGAEGGIFIFNADGSFTYTPTGNFPGFDYAQYTTQDAAGNQNTATVNVLSQNGGVVWKFYEQVLHRDPDYPGLQGWINDLTSGGKPGDIAVGFFESTELLNQIITGYYWQYLGRAPQGNDLAGWESVWRLTGGPEGIQAGFAASPEFNALAGNPSGNNPAGWITALYQRILQRTPESGAILYWEQQLAKGVSEYHVALDFFTSPEAFDNDVTRWFYEYLERAPSLAEQAHYANLMTAGASDRDIEQAITNLHEYSTNPSTPAANTGERLPAYFPLTAQPTVQQQASLAARDAIFSALG